MDPHRPKVGLGDDRVGMAKRYFDGEVRSLREKLSEKDVSLAKASRIQKVCVISSHFLLKYLIHHRAFITLKFFACICIFGVSIVYIIAILHAIYAMYYLLIHAKYESC